MAAIASIVAGIGVFAAAETAMSASDTITFSPSARQLLTLRNTTASPVVVTIDGNAGTTVAVAGVGNVSVASGLAVTVPASDSVGIVLSTIAEYCRGSVVLTGGVGVSARVINL
jgi:hypothetical protein